MNTRLADQHWFVSLNGKRFGPYTFKALTEASAKGVITAETHIWRLGWQQWHPARRVPGLLKDAPIDPVRVDAEAGRASELLPEATAQSVEATSRGARPFADDAAELPSMRVPPTSRDDEVNRPERPVRGGAASVSEVSDAPDLRDNLPPRDGADDGGDMTRPRGRRPSPAGAVSIYAPRLRDSRTPPDEGLPERQPPQKVPLRSEDQADDDIADGRYKLPKAVDLDELAGSIEPYRPGGGETLRDREPAGGGFWSFCKRAANGVLIVILLAGIGWWLLASGFLPFGESASSNRSREPRSPAATAARALSTTAPAGAAGIDLPASVASLPAIVALQRNDPASFERFRKRYADTAANASDDEALTLARTALRKSVKRLLAISPGDTLLEITDAYVAYMQSLRTSSPESCVALSDESKGARLTSNLAKEFPIQFMRDMSVLERVARANPNATIAPLTADEARPYLDTVFANLRRQPVKTELLGRDKLDPSEFSPYCTLVIAFYQTVLDLPLDDKVNLLRYLYASAAVDADNDLAK
jgi:hypothetical protein